MTSKDSNSDLPKLPPTLHAERRGAVAVLTLKRAEKRNALNDPTVQGIEAFFTALPEGIGAVVLAGEGEHFSAGLDLSELSERDVMAGIAHSQSWHRAFERIEFGTVPVVAVLQGAVVGGGLELAAAAHVRVAERSAFYALPEASRGIFVGGGGSVRIQRIVGYSVMADLMLTGRILTVDEAEKLNIVRYVVDEGQALAKAKELAARIAQNTPLTNWKITNVLPRINDLSHDDGLFMEYLNTSMEVPSESMGRLREFIEGRAAPLKAPNKKD
jgi:enoyl-CoA hydratase/carnithine racemase